MIQSSTRSHRGSPRSPLSPHSPLSPRGSIGERRTSVRWEGSALWSGTSPTETVDEGSSSSSARLASKRRLLLQISTAGPHVDKNAGPRDRPRHVPIVISPRHVPIIIPDWTTTTTTTAAARSASIDSSGACASDSTLHHAALDATDSAASISATSSVSSSSSTCAAASNSFSAASRKPRPRHVPIRIPDFALPPDAVPHSATSTSFSSTDACSETPLTPPDGAALSPLTDSATSNCLLTTTPSAGTKSVEASSRNTTGSTNTMEPMTSRPFVSPLYGTPPSYLSTLGSNPDDLAASQSGLFRLPMHEQQQQQQQHPLDRDSSGLTTTTTTSTTTTTTTNNTTTSASTTNNSTAASAAATKLPTSDSNANLSNMAQSFAAEKVATPSSASTNLSGLVCNVHRTTGNEPHSLVGATTTILGDKLYVFGGRRLSGRRAQMTSDLYELDLIKRHWTKIATLGEVPSPRYFHSVCALGDTKLVCYGGMSSSGPSSQGHAQQPSPAVTSPDEQPQPEVTVMSDIHIYDVPTRTWSAITTDGAPQGRYAHCACILPSSGTYTSADAPLSSMHHNVPSTGHSGTLGVSLDGAGGAEMVVVGGQDSANHYIEQVSVFNLRSLKWTATSPLGRSCGAYRSVVAPLPGMSASQLGAGDGVYAQSSGDNAEIHAQAGTPMLVYSNYNFLDVKLELQVRLPDGSLVEKPMQSTFSPPGLRFPNGGIVNNHFIVSGTFLTSSKQEYALWVLDLTTLTWSRIDAGGSIFTQGSWNRGVLWSRRNTYVILGNRRRNLVDDYHHRRINFSNICLVELEAFGLYDNPRKTSPLSGYISASSPGIPSTISERAGKTDWMNNGRPQSQAAIELGQMAMSLRELTDMDLVAIGGERVPVNSRLIARRWGPYFNRLLHQAAVAQVMPTTETNNLHPNHHHLSHPSRNSSVTITPSIGGVSSYSGATTLAGDEHTPSALSSVNAETCVFSPDPQSLPPWIRVRTLYLPHTHLTIQALVHYLYTSSLPPPSSPLCTPQILCSILQLARPYQIDGLLEATVERLHQILNQRNAAAVFNAAAIAAGGGRGVGLGRGGSGAAKSEAVSTSTTTAGGTPLLNNNYNNPLGSSATAPDWSTNGSSTLGPQVNTTTSPPTANGSSTTPISPTIDHDTLADKLAQDLRINTRIANTAPGADDDRLASAASTATNTDSEYDMSSSEQRTPERRLARDRDRRRRLGGATAHPHLGFDTDDDEPYIWQGEPSAVIGLHKRGLRGLMEGRRMRERGRSQGQANAPNPLAYGAAPAVGFGQLGSGGNATNSAGAGMSSSFHAHAQPLSQMHAPGHAHGQAQPQVQAQAQAQYQVFPSNMNHYPHSGGGGGGGGGGSNPQQQQHYNPSSSAGERIGLGIV